MHDCASTEPHVLVLQQAARSSSPGRTFICCINTLLASVLIPAPLMIIPGDGAVCPAIVRKGLVILRALVDQIIPPTSNIHVLEPLASTHWRNDP